MIPSPSQLGVRFLEPSPTMGSITTPKMSKKYVMSGGDLIRTIRMMIVRSVGKTRTRMRTTMISGRRRGLLGITWITFRGHLYLLLLRKLWREWLPRLEPVDFLPIRTILLTLECLDTPCRMQGDRCISLARL